MKVVVDANRLVAGLLSEGAAREALLACRAELVAPRFLLREVRRHRADLLKRSGLGVAAFDTLLENLTARIVWVEDEALGPHYAAAQRALGTVDPKDVPYLACALAVRAAAIWSHDKDFDRQDLVRRVGHPDAAATVPRK